MSSALHNVVAGEGDLPSGSVTLAPGVSVDWAHVRFAFARSGGPGGQNVNKRSTKAELRVNPRILPMHAAAVERLLHNARGYLTEEGDILIVSDEHRSQGQNKDECLQRLRTMIVQAQAIPKRRIKTKPSRGSKERRIQAKKVRGEIKKHRSGGSHD